MGRLPRVPSKYTQVLSFAWFAASLFTVKHSKAVDFVGALLAWWQDANKWETKDSYNSRNTARKSNSSGMLVLVMKYVAQESN